MIGRMKTHAQLALNAALVCIFLVLASNQASAKSRWAVPRDHGPASKQLVNLETQERPGTIIISNEDRTLDVVQDRQTVARYRIGVGRDGFTWSGTVRVGRKAEWPAWRPPAAMRKRSPGLPSMVPPGPHNPLGARAIYLFDQGSDTLYRIHGTNDSDSVGGFVSSGCFRLSNKDILELYNKVKIGTKVIVR
jgi:lipoprotein-anchoring transpeptidase ErfK/SrfK